MFAHVPGLKVVMPATPYDAKGLMIAAIRDPNPVIYIDDRWLYRQRGRGARRDLRSADRARAIIRKAGKDVTVVAVSFMVAEAHEGGSRSWPRQGSMSRCSTFGRSSPSMKSLDAGLGKEDRPARGRRRRVEDLRRGGGSVPPWSPRTPSNPESAPSGG